MKRKPNKTIVEISLLCLWLIAICVCVLVPIKTGDATLDTLLRSVLTRVVVIIGLCKIVASEFPQLLKACRPTKKHLLWLLPCLLVPLANFPFSALASGRATVERTDLLWLFLLKCLLIGVTEEWLFRGIAVDLLRPYFKKSPHAVWKLALSVSTAFALFHLFNLLDGASAGATLLQMGYSFLTGGLFVTVYLKLNDLWPCVALHTLFDVGGLLVNDLGKGSPWDEPFWIATVVCGLLVGAHVLLTLHRLDKNS